MNTPFDRSNVNSNLLGALGSGALLMYLFDPRLGRRRRAWLRDKMIRVSHKTADAIDATVKDVRNRTVGLAATARQRLAARPMSDERLAANIRKNLGPLVSHPGAIDVSAEAGKVTLSGPILADELERLLSHVMATPEVAAVENRLEPHTDPGNVPALQGPAGRPQIGTGSGFHAGKLVADDALVGRHLWRSAGAFRGQAIERPGRAAAAALGSAIVVRAATNMEYKRLTGIGAGRHAVTVHKITNVAAPVDEVFAFWSNYENFPRFMSNVRDVKKTGEKQSRWIVAGPAGVSIVWNAIITNYVPNKSLGWKTVPDSAIQHTGIVRFEPNTEGGTRIDIRMSHNPVAGALGHAVASIFGADPKREIEQDLVRMRTLIQSGRPPHDAAARGDETYAH